MYMLVFSWETCYILKNLLKFYYFVVSRMIIYTHEYITRISFSGTNRWTETQSEQNSWDEKTVQRYSWRY